MKTEFLVTLILTFAFFTNISAQNNEFLLGTIFKLERTQEAIRGEIRFYEMEIKKTEDNISKSEKIIYLAREQNNPEAEKIAQNALIIAKDTKAKNISARNAAEAKLLQTEFALYTAKNEFNNPIPSMENYEAIMSAYTGQPKVQNADGTTFTIDKTRPLFLKKGSVVTTNADSGLELQTFGGRGSIKLSGNTKIEIGKDSDAENEFIKLLQGKIEIGIEKLEVFEKDLEKLIKSYEEDLKTIKDEIKEKIVKEYKARKEAQREKRRKFYLQHSAGIAAVRGTRFSAKADDSGSIEFIVTEGIVELSSPKSGKKVEVKAGEKATISKDGIISKPEKTGG
jgi:hypothetical protein